MIVVNREEMIEFENYTMDILKIDNIKLMEKVASNLAKDFLKRVKPNINTSITIISGIGNNGADALALALKLREKGYITRIYIIGSLIRASNAFNYYYNLNDKIINISSLLEVEENKSKIIESDFIIDGIFGIGLNKEIKGYRDNLIKYINYSKALVYSIDIPSGIDSFSGKALGRAIKADYTGVIGYYKIGNIINDALDFHGLIELINIELIEKYKTNKLFIDALKYNLNLPNRKNNSNKYNYGLGLFIGGRDSMMGSIQMAAYSGLKTGLGVAVILSSNNDYYTQFYPEVILDTNKFGKIKNYLDKANIAVFGPGLEENNKDNLIILEYLIKRNIPILIDATGLKYLDLDKDYSNNKIILTPHLGEISKLLNVSSKTIAKNPLKYIDVLTEKGFNVILKGPGLVIANKERTIFLQAKNPGLATAGTGDILSGIISAYLNDFDLIDAMLLGVITHSKAADLARNKYGIRSLVASNIIEFIHEVLQ